MAPAPSGLTSISNRRPATVVSSTTLGESANRSSNPADQPSCLKFGVVSGGRNVFIVGVFDLARKDDQRRRRGCVAPRPSCRGG